MAFGQQSVIKFLKLPRFGEAIGSSSISLRGVVVLPQGLPQAVMRRAILSTLVVLIFFDQPAHHLSEREIIELRLRHVPVTTISPFHFNAISFARSSELAELVRGGARYPLVGGRAKLACRSDGEVTGGG